MIQTIHKIIEKLKDYPDINYEHTDNSVTIIPKDENGFMVDLTAHSENAFTVSFDFWHEEFEKEEEALNCFSFGLTKTCRIKRTKRGPQPFIWTVQYLDQGIWKDDSTTGLFNFKFWKRKSVDYLQNDLIKSKI